MSLTGWFLISLTSNDQVIHSKRVRSGKHFRHYRDFAGLCHTKAGNASILKVDMGGP